MMFYLLLFLFDNAKIGIYLLYAKYLQLKKAKDVHLFNLCLIFRTFVAVTPKINVYGQNQTRKKSNTSSTG